MACGRTIRKAVTLGLFALFAILAAAAPSTAQELRADVSVDTSGGYARLVLTLSDDVNVSVQHAGNVMIISFAKPLFVSVDRLPAQAPDYIGAARRDPDGRAIRLALERKVTVHSIAAAEKFFIDLLPDTWSGAPPGLPQDVVEDLARRVREAERLERLAHQREEQKKYPPVRVRVAIQPTFTRYVFDIPDQTAVSTDRAKERLTLTFDTPLTFDLTDAEAALPPGVGAINAEVEADSALVRFGFLGAVDVRTFRDGKAFVVDVVTGETSAAPRGKAGANILSAPIALEAPPTAQAPAESATPAAAETPIPAAEQPNISAPSTIGAESAMRAPARPAPVKPAPAPPNPATPAPLTPNPATPNPAAPNPVAPNPAIPSPVTPNPPTPNPPPNQGAAPSAAPTAPAAKAEAPALASAQPPASPSPSEGRSGDSVTVELSRQGANLKLSFPFNTPTAAAVFHRADTLWIVFDSKSAIDLRALDGEASHTIRNSEFVREGDAAIVRIRLDHPHLSSVAVEGTGWAVTIGDTVTDPTHALDIARNLVGASRASITVSFEAPHQLHRIRDPGAGDDLLVVTGFAPARGFINEQDFIEFHALASTHGVVIEPLADDIVVELAGDKVVVGRPGGLTLSSSLQSVLHGSALHPVMFDSQVWGLDRQSDFSDRQAQLMSAAASAPASKRLPQRLDLARFYIAREMYPEAKGVLDVVLAEDRSGAGDVTAGVLRAVAEVMMSRPDDALKDLSNPAIGDQHDAPVWRALAYARQGRWGLARDSFKRVEMAIAALPAELQRVALQTEMRTAIEVGDFASAGTELNDLETIGLPREMQPSISVLVGRLSQGIGRNEEALAAYRTAADSWDRPAAAQGRLREAALRYALGDIKREDVISDLETLTTIWRGDDTEVGALEILARLYTEEGRYRDSFYVMRNAVAAHPDSDMTRRIQEEAAATFETLFLADKGNTLSAIDALALFYDFRELTPIGRRGDEMIRRLADRLVAVDLLDQAADLLQYQVDHRLQGAARAQVAIRLAVIYLMNHKPDRALVTLRSTRTADLANELRNQRLLLEARALSDLGRYDVALEVVANLAGRETIRLRSDILWAAKRWAKSAEQIELYYGDRWKQWQPLNEVERADILRATIGYALGEDALGLGRFRERYAAKMAQTPDAHAFEVVSAALGTSGAEFRDIARAAASVDTLEGFLRDMQARYPDAGAISSTAAGSANTPASAGTASVAGVPAPQPAALTPAPPARAAGKTAQR